MTFVSQILKELMQTPIANERINTLESQIGNMDKQLSEIKKLLEAKEPSPVQAKDVSKGYAQGEKHNEEKLATVKAPPAQSVLVLGKTNDSNTNPNHIELVQKAMMDNNIALQNTSTKIEVVK